MRPSCGLSDPETSLANDRARRLHPVHPHGRLDSPHHPPRVLPAPPPPPPPPPATPASIPAPPPAVSSSSAATAVAASPSATTTAFLLRPSLIHYQRPAQKIFSVQRFDCFHRVGIICNFRKTEAARLIRETVPQ